MNDDYQWSWTQPCCESCYADRYPNREPVRLREPDTERCAWCGRITDEGIYVRVDPATVTYPSRLRVDD